MNEEKMNIWIIICYIVIIASMIGAITFMLILLLLSDSNKYWAKNYDFFFKFLISILTLGMIIPPFIIAYIKKK